MKRFIAVMLLTLFFGISCTEKERARSFGGVTTTKLPKGQKLITATWKESDLWLLTRPMRTGETAETYTLKEDSSFGVMEGTVTIVEE